jgi:hypothetical protein
MSTRVVDLEVELTKIFEYRCGDRKELITCSKISCKEEDLKK